MTSIPFAHGFVTCQARYPREQSGGGVSLTNHFQLAPTLRIAGDIPSNPLYAFMARTRTTLHLPWVYNTVPTLPVCFSAYAILFFGLPANPVHLSCLESAVFSLYPVACSFADLNTYVSAATSRFQLCCFQTTPCTSSPKPSSRFAILLLSSMLYHVTITAAK